MHRIMLLAVAAISAHAALRIDRIQVEGGTPHPRFQWTLASTNPAGRGMRQEAYRILCARAAKDLEPGHADLWDSGKAWSAETAGIEYDGKPLRSQSRYSCRIQVWDQTGAASAWSAPVALITGVLEASEWKARWIATTPDTEREPQARESVVTWKEKADAMPLFRREFRVPKPLASAIASISGLGQYELRLNGADVTDTVLNPGWTNCRRTVLFNTFDVTKLARTGANAMGVVVGNGMYNVERVRGRYTKFAGSFGQPKVIVQLRLRYTDGTEEMIASDAAWTTHAGPIVYSSTYGGEDFDARLEPKGWSAPGFAGDGWKAALAVEGPGGQLREQECAPVRVFRRYEPVAVTEPRPGTLVYDLGQNMSGWPEIQVAGAAGSTVKLIAGELLDANGLVTQHSANARPGAENSYSYTLAGGGPETWRPRFAYWGFRYVQVEGAARTADAGKPVIQALHGDFLHDDLPAAGRFTTSNELLNRIHTLIDMAILSNSFSVLTDCPHREKLGWLEQTYLNGASLFFNSDYQSLYRKLALDMEEAQLADGMMPGIAPEYVAFVRATGESTAFRNSPEWGSAAILSPWTAYTFTGDRAALERAYPVMQRYGAYLRTQLADGLLTFGLGDWYDTGPGNPGYSQLTSKELTATATYYEDLTVLARTAHALHQPDQERAYLAEAETIRAAINRKLFHADTNQYDRGSQTANAMALAVGLAPAGHEAAVLENLIADIRKHENHVTAGDVGFHYVARALTEARRGDVLFDMLSRTDSPSYGYQISRGATTLTEAWDTNPNSSQNHFMLGHAEEWFYRGLAGIQIDLSQPAAARLAIRPQTIAGLESASATYDGALGMVRSAWTLASDGLHLDVSIPPNATAQIEIPTEGAARITVEGKPLAASGIGACTAGAHATTCTVASGNYRFVSSR